MKGETIDTDELMLDYTMVRLALEGLTYAVSEGRDVGKHLVNARQALIWAKTLDEYGQNCEDCDNANG